MGLKKWNMNFCEECSDQQNRTNFSDSDTLLLLETFPLLRPEKSCSIYFLTGISGNFLKMINHQVISNHEPVT